MKFEKELSRVYKHRALVWLRTVKRCGFICTEFGQFNADCFGVSEARSIEVEIKTSWADFRNDFKKAYKHATYKKDWSLGHNYHVPMYFYFAVPSDIVDKCGKHLIARAKSDGGKNHYGLIDADSWAVKMRARKLHDNTPPTKLKFQMALRMGSELLRFHEALL